MKTLEKVFMGTGEVKKILFTQLFRFKDLCLYERSDHCWEVIKARYQKAGTMKRGEVVVELQEKEIYPKGENWGVHDWTAIHLNEQ